MVTLMKKILRAVCYFLLFCVLLRACGIIVLESHKHDWQEATCTQPRTCSGCGETDGEPLGHRWSDATCTFPMICDTCGKHSGKSLGHDWIMPTCTEPKTCARCGLTSGEPYGHDTFPVTVSKSTCQSPGVIEEKCHRCGIVVSSYETPLDDHILGKPVIIDEGSPTTPRIAVIYCKICNAELERTSHQYGASMYDRGAAGNGSSFNAYDNKDQQQVSGYILNQSSKRFHYPSCSDVPKIAPKNYSVSSETRETIISMGYQPCGHCAP